MIKIGDTQVPFHGVNDRTDGYDNMVGTFKTLTNMYVTKDKQSIKSRNGFSTDVAVPSTLTLRVATNEITTVTADGTNYIATDFVLSDILHVNWFKITEPEEKIVRVSVCIYKWTNTDINVGGETVYMMRTLMYPYWDDTLAPPAFVNQWKDVTPYYLDLQTTSAHQVFEVATDLSVITDIAMTNNCHPNKYDCPGGYYYINLRTYAGTKYFGTAIGLDQHLAEGDKAIYDATNKIDRYNAGTYAVTMRTEGTHANHNGGAGWSFNAGLGEFRFHKNLETGKINYFDLCSTTLATLQKYTIDSFQIGEKIVISYHAGDSDKPNYTLQLDYIKKTFFGTGHLWSHYDYAFDDGDADVNIDHVYDSLLVYGLPGINTVTDAITGKTFSVYIAAGVPAPHWIGVGGYTERTDTVQAYDKYTGKVTLNNNMAVAAFGSDVLYKIKTTTISKSVDDFVVSEFDLHGRSIKYKSFGLTSTRYESAFCHFTQELYNGAASIQLFTHNTQYPASSNSTAVTAVTGETGFTTTTQQYFFNYLTALHQYYRAGLHHETKDWATVVNTGTNYNVLAQYVNVPFTFNRTMSNVQLGIYQKDADNIDDYLQAFMVYNDDISSNNNWDFHTCLCEYGGILGSFTINENNYQQFSYYRVFRIDKTRYDRVQLASNHLYVTGNPAYSSEPDIADTEFVYATGTKNSVEKAMCKDISWGAKTTVPIRDRIFSGDMQLNEWQMGTALTATELTDPTKAIYQVLYSPISIYGGNFHLFNAITQQILARDIGKTVALTHISVSQGEATQENRNNLLILAENGYIYYDMRSNDPVDWIPSMYKGDCCIARKSVVSHGGFAFYAGRNGVYMFDGQKQVNICTLGGSSVQNTWQAVTDANKLMAIGVFNNTNNQYWLIYPSTTGWKALVFDFGDYLFDMEKADIFTYDSSYKPGVGMAPDIYLDINSKNNTKFIDGVLYLSYYDTSYFYFTKLDTTAYVDVGQSGTILEGYLITNNFKPIDKISKFEYLSLIGTYTNDNVFIGAIVNDRIGYGAPYLYLDIGNNVYTEWKMPPSINMRGNRFAIEVGNILGNTTLYEMNLKINTDIHQRRLVKNND